MAMNSRAPLFVLPVLILILVSGFSAAADQRLSGLLLRIQRLEREVQQLHGQLEVQQHERSILRRRQREQYLVWMHTCRVQWSNLHPITARETPLGRGALPRQRTLLT